MDLLCLIFLSRFSEEVGERKGRVEGRGEEGEEGKGGDNMFLLSSLRKRCGKKCLNQVLFFFFFFPLRYYSLKYNIDCGETKLENEI